MDNLELSDVQLKELKELSASGLSIEECATVLEVDFQHMKLTYSDKSSALAKAYDAGRLLSKAKNNRAILELAERGSGPAQLLWKKIQDEQSAKNV